MERTPDAHKSASQLITTQNINSNMKLFTTHTT